MKPEVQEAIEYMTELKEESGVPKNVKTKISVIITELQQAQDKELSLLINKLLSDLDDISSDANLDSFTRQQIWSISSMLEAIDC